MRCCWTRRIAHRAARAQTVAVPTTLPTATPAVPAVPPPARSAGARAPAPAAPIAARQRAARAERRRQRTSTPGIGARPRPRAATRGVAHARGGRCRPNSTASARACAGSRDRHPPRRALAERLHSRTPVRRGPRLAARRRTAHTEPRRTGVGAAYKGADRSATVQGRNSVAPKTAAVGRAVRDSDWHRLLGFWGRPGARARRGQAPSVRAVGREC